MKHRPRLEEQDDLLRPRLIDLIDPRHELMTLAALIDWEVFEREWAGFFPSGKGQTAAKPRLVAGLLYLQHVYQTRRRSRTGLRTPIASTSPERRFSSIDHRSIRHR